MKDKHNKVCELRQQTPEKQEIFFKSALDHFEKIFRTRPNRVPIKANPKGLAFWEAAALWIDEDSCHIQLKSLKPPPFYSLDEILSHELVHAVRFKLNEPLFEEILAFRTSKNRFRRYFGPLFATTKQTKLFLSSLLLSWAGYIIGGLIELALLQEVSLVLPLFILSLFLIRLIYYQTLFARALRSLSRTDAANPLARLLFLKDSEIKELSYKKD